MEKRGIIAIILTFLIIVLWSFIQSKFFPSEPQKEVKKEQAEFQEKKLEEQGGRQATPIQTTANEKQGVKQALKGKEVPLKEVNIETQNFWAVLTNEDGRLKQFKLKKYKDRVEESGITIKILNLVEEILGKKPRDIKKPEALDLINTKAEEGLPLGLTAQNSNSAFVEGNWETDRDKLILLNPGEKGEIIFTKHLENGLLVLKRYRFHSENETIDLEVEVQNQSSKEATVHLGVEWIGKIELSKFADEGNKDFGLNYSLLKNQKVDRRDLGGSSSGGCTPGCEPAKKKIEPFEITEKGDIRWFTFGGEYFLVLIAPPPTVKELALNVKGNEKNILKANISPNPIQVLPQQTVKMPFKVYLGPKEESRLKAIGVEAEKLIDFGWFTIVAKPLLWILNLTHSATNNFGIDIIILSILIKILFLPLTQISMRSMKEMQKVQPEMNRLRETYKNDKAKLQQEIMLLYKRRKVNPMSGCLPMLIQIPVFIALYNALQNTIEMRHAPFFFWLQDLSAKDPIYITPIIMGATMVIQQKMTPTAADPTQAKMFLLMPIMFTFLFLNFPSGLVLYWLVNNVLSIAHQYYMNKKM